MVHCQSAAAGCLRWPLWSGATSVYVPVSRLRPYPDVEGCLVISFVHGLANLVDVKCIKCTCKGGDWTSFSGKIRKIMNSDQTTRRLVPLFFFTQNGAVLGFKYGFLRSSKQSSNFHFYAIVPLIDLNFWFNTITPLPNFNWNPGFTLLLHISPWSQIFSI